MGTHVESRLVVVGRRGMTVAAGSRVANMRRASMAAAAAFVVAGAAHGAIKTWTGGAGTSSWHDANNWSPAGVPGATDDVVIDVPETITVDFTTGTTTINSLECAETLSLNGGTLIVSTTASVTGHASLNGGTIQGGTWLLANPMMASGSLNNRVVGVTVEGDVTLAVSNARLRFVNGLTVNGKIELSGSDAWLLCEGSQTLDAEVVFSGGNQRKLGFWPPPSGAGVLTLTLGAGTVLRGQPVVVGNLGGPTFWSTSVVNYGVISADVAQAFGFIAISGGGTFTNFGTVQAMTAGAQFTMGTVANGITNFDGTSGTLTGGTWSAGSGATLVWPFQTIRTLGPGTTVSLSGLGSSFPAVNGLTTLGTGSTFALAGGRDFNASPLDGTFTNGGVLDLGAQCDLAVSGAYSQSASGTLATVVNSSDGPPRVSATGNLALGGAFDMSLIGGFTPAWGQVFGILTADTVTGGFETISLPELAAPLFWQVSVAGAQVSLRVGRIGDINDDGIVDGSDLAVLLGQWGPCSDREACVADLNGDGEVDGSDLAILLGHWAP